jgi:hypothetical protein
LGDHSFTAEKCHVEAFQERLMKLQRMVWNSTFTSPVITL